MKISARNQLKGTVTSVIRGPISSKVTVDIGGGNVITSVVMSDAIDELDIKDGDPIIAIIKAPTVLLAKE